MVEAARQVLRRRRPGDAPAGRDTRLDAFIDLLSAPGRPAELGDEARIRALFLATRATRPPTDPIIPLTPFPWTGAITLCRATSHRSAACRWSSSGLGTALNTVVVAVALAVSRC